MTTMQLDLTDFWGSDYLTLQDEYNSEDKKEYELLLSEYIPTFDEISKKGVADSIWISLPNSTISFIIRIYKTPYRYRPFFIFTLEHINPNFIKPIPIIRTLSKLCIYISQLPLTNESNLSISSGET